MKSNKQMNQSIVANRIDEILKDHSFDFSIEYFKFVHAFLFKGIFENSGQFRQFNISKPEIILNEKSVIYADYHTIDTYLSFDFREQSLKKIKMMSEKSFINSITKFTSNIWQTHPFSDGNTRTTIVFISKYLKSLGYNVENEFFKENYSFFRKALVISAYYNHELGIHNDYEALRLFFEILMLNEDVPLDEEKLYIPKLKEVNKETNSKVKKRILDTKLKIF